MRQQSEVVQQAQAGGGAGGGQDAHQLVAAALRRRLRQLRCVLGDESRGPRLHLEAQLHGQAGAPEGAQRVLPERLLADGADQPALQVLLPAAGVDDLDEAGGRFA
ncbi:MAG: hypothetical protein HYS09_03430 [Chloroflexi bacterium]|nr:hypothetical protein [Chloroflexota bacterium]